MIRLALVEGKGQVVDPTDEELVAACAEGNKEGLGLLFDRHEARTRRFLSRLLGSAYPDLDDAVQATFLETWRAAPRFRGRSTVSSWILGIAANLARHAARSEHRMRAALRVMARTPRPEAPGLEKTFVQRELASAVERRLEELPHDQRVAFVLCDIEQLRGVDAAKVLGVRPGTLARRLHDARRTLRGALTEGGEA